MNTQNITKDKITHYSKELRLPTFRSEFERVAQASALKHADYEDFLLNLMEIEYDMRVENRKKEQVRQACMSLIVTFCPKTRVPSYPY